MDSNDLERERGITILAKATSVVWKGVRINIVDTPGHADFGGEVERILSMVDSCLLLVDAAEGPMPQTKFVLGKALRKGLRPIAVINKVDKPEQRSTEVLNEIFDLFAALDADERNGLGPLFDLILEHVAPPTADKDGPFRMLATTLEANPYLGRLLTGRIESGRAKANMAVKSMTRDGQLIEQ